MMILLHFGLNSLYIIPAKSNNRRATVISGCGHSILGDIQNPTGCGSEQPALSQGLD